MLAVLSVVVSTQVLGSGKYLGASTTFVRAAGFVEQGVVPGNVAENDYFQRNKPKVDWQMMVVAGIFLGALVASRLDGSFKLESTPPVWSDRFGSKISVRAIGAFLGGAVAMFGARGNCGWIHETAFAAAAEAGSAPDQRISPQRLENGQ